MSPHGLPLLSGVASDVELANALATAITTSHRSRADVLNARALAEAQPNEPTIHRDDARSREQSGGVPGRRVITI